MHSLPVKRQSQDQRKLFIIC